MYAASLVSIDFVEKLLREENIACDFARCGHSRWLASETFRRFPPQRRRNPRHFNHKQRIIPKTNSIRNWLAIYHGGLVDDTSAA